jgi:AcrR family transcriptional regulator
MPRTAGFELDREQVLAGALRLLSSQGFGDLTMRKLATELRVTPTAIYYYFPNKDALIDAVVESLFAQLELPPPGPWQERLRTILGSARGIFGGYPGALPYLFSRVSLTPSGLRLTNEAMGWLFEAGFDEEQVGEAALMCAILLIGQSQLEALQSNPATVHPDAPLVADIDFATLPNIVRLVPQFARPVGQREFDYALDLLISDLEHRLPASVR